MAKYRNWHLQGWDLSQSSLLRRKDGSHDSKAEKREKFMSDSPPAARFGRWVKHKHNWGYEANRLTRRSSWKFVASFDLVPVPALGNGRWGELEDEQIWWSKICISMVIVAWLLTVLKTRHMRVRSLKEQRQATDVLRSERGVKHTEKRQRPGSMLKEKLSEYIYSPRKMFRLKYVWCVERFWGSFVCLWCIHMEEISDATLL